MKYVENVTLTHTENNKKKYVKREKGKVMIIHKTAIKF